MPEHPFDNGDMFIRDELLELWPRTPAAMQQYLARYYGAISHMDHHLGRLIGRLEARGALDNTVIVFTGDQGLAVGSHGLLGKESMYDPSIASPLILAGPGIPAGGRSAAMSHHVDLFPTLCELCDLPRPASASDGHSLLPILTGEVERVREDTYCEFYSPAWPGQPMRHTQRCLRTESWKLTWYPQVGRYQLFDLRHDPAEMVDLLTSWRIQFRKALESESRGKMWTGGTWAPNDTRPAYTQAQITAVVADLHQRLLAQMARHDDPLLSESPPPVPVVD